MTDRADLTHRLEEAARKEEVSAAIHREAGSVFACYHDHRAALLREAAKALEGGE